MSFFQSCQQRIHRVLELCQKCMPENAILPVNSSWQCKSDQKGRWEKNWRKQRRKHASLSSSYYQAVSYHHLPSPSMSDCTDIPSLPKKGSRGSVLEVLFMSRIPSPLSLCGYIVPSPSLKLCAASRISFFFFFPFFYCLFFSLFLLLFFSRFTKSP